MVYAFNYVIYLYVSFFAPGDSFVHIFNILILDRHTRFTSIVFFYRKPIYAKFSITVLPRILYQRIR